MAELSTIYDYMRSYAPLLGERILQEYPALQQFEDPVSPRLEQLLRTPKPAQNVAIMGVVKRWQRARTAMFVAECGTGKTLMSLAAVHVHSAGKPYTALAMVPPHLVEKWAREADPEKIHRMAPIEFIGRYMPGWFDYAICDEIHQLAGDTAQGNALGTLAACTDKIVGLTGTLLGGYADDLFNTLFRLEPRKMKQRGYEFGTAGRSAFAQDYGVLETITKIEPAENACSKAKATTTIRRKPGASPLLFGEFLMDLCAFVFLEDISGELPPYEETCVNVPMEPLMRAAYGELEDAIRTALKEHRGNRSVLSIMLHTLLLYPDHPYGLGSLYGTKFDPQLQRKVKFLIAHTRDLPQDRLHAKERRLVEEIKRELAEGRRCQVFAVYTQKRDVTARLREILANEGIVPAIWR